VSWVRNDVKFFLELLTLVIVLSLLFEKVLKF
jgi:hypothetical protein